MNTTTWVTIIADTLNHLLTEAGVDKWVLPADIAAEKPPKPELGDIGFPMAAYAKFLKKSPADIAAIAAALAVARVAEKNLSNKTTDTVFAAGPYLNVRLDRNAGLQNILEAALSEGFGKLDKMAGRRVTVEFGSPNTNKPLHLGHLRNDVLGESLSRILKAAGADVRKVCIINDRGVHICKSMLAYKESGAAKTPESEHVKSDRFVGDCYVQFHRMAEAAPEKGYEEAAQEMLRKWEAGDADTVALWKTMNGWAIKGIKATYERTGVSFDQYYYESETYLKGKDEVLQGLKHGIFQKEPDGAVSVDLEAEDLGKKTLLRKDGTSIYITQDIGLAILRHNDWPFDGMIYVVGSEQQHHFKVLFSILKKLKLPWAEKLYHLSYGMVNLPEGKMKSREGTVVDADDLLDSLKSMAVDEIKAKEREEAVGDVETVAESIALGALHYYLLSTTPSKDMLFDPKASLSFTGNTGPYLQYMGARISSLLKKAGDASAVVSIESINGMTINDAEWELAKAISDYPDTVAQAASSMDSSHVALYLYDLSRAFSRFYRDCPVLGADDAKTRDMRLSLCRAVLGVMTHAFDLVCIPFLEAM
jgi:arginyl-tRNA synthetase